MVDRQPDSGNDPEVQRQLEELTARVAADRADIDALQARADAANHRADASEARADVSEARADASEARADVSQARADVHEVRIGNLEGRLDIDEKIIAELQAEGFLRREDVAHVEEALGRSRTIGSAIGIVMANRKVAQQEAFQILVKASNRTNRKLWSIAEDVVLTGDVSDLPVS